MGIGCPKKDTVILADASTQRRHMEYLHAVLLSQCFYFVFISNFYYAVECLS